MTGMRTVSDDTQRQEHADQLVEAIRWFRDFRQTRHKADQRLRERLGLSPPQADVIVLYGISTCVQDALGTIPTVDRRSKTLLLLETQLRATVPNEERLMAEWLLHHNFTNTSVATVPQVLRRAQNDPSRSITVLLGFELLNKDSYVSFHHFGAAEVLEDLCAPLVGRNNTRIVLVGQSYKCGTFDFNVPHAVYSLFPAEYVSEILTDSFKVERQSGKLESH